MSADRLNLTGVTVTPHLQSRELRYRREPDFSLGARVLLFLRNAGREAWVGQPDTAIRLCGKSPDELLTSGEWAWHDFLSAWTNAPLKLPPGARTVWSFNGSRSAWGVGTEATLDLNGRKLNFDIAAPCVWLSAVTLLGNPTNPFPDSLIFHVANQTRFDLRLESCRLWLPKDNSSGESYCRRRGLRTSTLFPPTRQFPRATAAAHGRRQASCH